MPTNRRTTPLAFLMLLALSCIRGGPGVPAAADPALGRDKGPSLSPAAARVFRGHAVHGHEVRAFRPCGSREDLWAVDRSGLLWTLHGELVPNGVPRGEIFAVVEGAREPAPAEGFGAGYPGALRVDAVLYAGLEGPNCEAGWARFRYRAVGNEPFWSAVISAGGLRVTRLGEEDLVWPEVREERGASGVRFTAGGRPDRVPASLEITPTPCRDSMSGAYFAYSGHLRLEGRELAGCVLPGDEPAPP